MMKDTISANNRSLFDADTGRLAADLLRHAPKRVALFSGNYNYVMDGPVRALNKLVGFLEAQGIDVRVFAPTVKQPAFQHTGTLVSVPSFAIPGRGEYRIGLPLTPALRAYLRDFKPDLVHLAAPDVLGVSALRWARKHGVPAVSSFHTRFDTYVRYYGLAWLEAFLQDHMRGFYARVEHVYAPSQSMIDVLRSEGMGRDIRTWTRGVDTDVFTPMHRDLAWRRSLGIADHEVVMLFVGRLVLEKGLGFYADIFDALKAKGLPIRGIVVGAGPERENFEQRLPDAVFLGFQNGKDLGRAYASSDIFFNASVTETFGNVTLEAMASGIPSVCADATGSRTLVADGQSGYLIPLTAAGEADFDGYLTRMTELVSNAALRQQFGLKALERSKPYSWDSVLAELVSHYADALAGYRAPEKNWFGRPISPDLPAYERS